KSVRRGVEHRLRRGQHAIPVLDLGAVADPLQGRDCRLDVVVGLPLTSQFNPVALIDDIVRGLLDLRRLLGEPEAERFIGPLILGRLGRWNSSLLGTERRNETDRNENDPQESREGPHAILQMKAWRAATFYSAAGEAARLNRKVSFRHHQNQAQIRGAESM